MGFLDAKVHGRSVAEVTFVEGVVACESGDVLVEVVFGVIESWVFLGRVGGVHVAFTLGMAVGSGRALLVFHADDVGSPLLPVMIVFLLLIITDAKVFSVVDQHLSSPPRDLKNVVAATRKITTEAALMTDSPPLVVMVDGIFDSTVSGKRNTAAQNAYVIVVIGYALSGKRKTAAPAVTIDGDGNFALNVGRELVAG